MQRFAQDIIQSFGVDHAQAGLIHVHDAGVGINGQNALVQGVQDSLALMEHPLKGGRFISHKGLLDGAGEVAGQHQTYAGGDKREDQKAANSINHCPVDAAHTDAHRHKAQ